jgi:hypothetical protein
VPGLLRPFTPEVINNGLNQDEFIAGYAQIIESFEVFVNRRSVRVFDIDHRCLRSLG